MSRQDKKYTQYANDASGILDYYMELRNTNSSNSCEQFYQALGVGQGRSTGGKYHPVQASSSDFIADVETTTRKFLSPVEYTLFVSIYMNSNLDQAGIIANDGRNTAKVEHILRKLGQAFTERGIAPLQIYFKPKDTR